MTQRVLVTAGASGIGKEIARAFAANGAVVFVTDIDQDALSVLKREVPGAMTAVCDMASRAEIERTMPLAIESLGGLDVLINNAGIAGPTASVEHFDPDEWDKVVQVNLTGTFDVTRLAIPHLKRSSSGSIVIMSSVAGRFGYPNRSVYAVTKWGLIGLTKTLSRELGEFGIRVNAILPGAVAGPRLQGVYKARAKESGRPLDEVKAAAMELQSVKHLVDPSEIAALAIFLTSEAGRSISGQALPVDNDMQNAS